MNMKGYLFSSNNLQNEIEDVNFVQLDIIRCKVICIFQKTAKNNLNRNVCIDKWRQAKATKNFPLELCSKYTDVNCLLVERKSKLV